MKPTYDFKGKTVVITGGGGVLCSVFAGALYGAGASIALIDINEERAKAAAQRIGEGVIGIGANCLDKQELTAARDIIVGQFGGCDILINGAGGNHPDGTTADEWLSLEKEDTAKEVKTFFDLDSKGIEFVLDLNFLGTLLPTQVFAPLMVGRDGVIINVSSMNAYRPLTKIPAYSGAKAAVSNLTQWLAVYFAKAKIRVNAIAPGFFVSDQNRALLFDDNGELSARGQKIIGATPMGRFGEPNELCGALMFLCDNNSAGFVTGTVLPIDGGFSAYSGV